MVRKSVRPYSVIEKEFQALDRKDAKLRAYYEPLTDQEREAAKLGRVGSLIATRHRYAEVLRWEDDVSVVASADAAPEDRDDVVAARRSASGIRASLSGVPAGACQQGSTGGSGRLVHGSASGSAQPPALYEPSSSGSRARVGDGASSSAGTVWPTTPRRRARPSSAPVAAAHGPPPPPLGGANAHALAAAMQGAAEVMARPPSAAPTPSPPASRLLAQYSATQRLENVSVTGATAHLHAPIAAPRSLSGKHVPSSGGGADEGGAVAHVRVVQGAGVPPLGANDSQQGAAGVGEGEESMQQQLVRFNTMQLSASSASPRHTRASANTFFHAPDVLSAQEEEDLLAVAAEMYEESAMGMGNDSSSNAGLPGMASQGALGAGTAATTSQPALTLDAQLMYLGHTGGRPTSASRTRPHSARPGSATNPGGRSRSASPGAGAGDGVMPHQGWSMSGAGGARARPASARPTPTAVHVDIAHRAPPRPWSASLPPPHPHNPGGLQGGAWTTPARTPPPQAGQPTPSPAHKLTSPAAPPSPSPSPSPPPSPWQEEGDGEEPAILEDDEAGGEEFDRVAALAPRSIRARPSPRSPGHRHHPPPPGLALYNTHSHSPVSQGRPPSGRPPSARAVYSGSPATTTTTGALRPRPLSAATLGAHSALVAGAAAAAGLGSPDHHHNQYARPRSASMTQLSPTRTSPMPSPTAHTHTHHRSDPAGVGKGGRARCGASNGVVVRDPGGGSVATHRATRQRAWSAHAALSAEASRPLSAVLRHRLASAGQVGTDGRDGVLGLVGGGGHTLTSVLPDSMRMRVEAGGVGGEGEASFVFDGAGGGGDSEVAWMAADQGDAARRELGIIEDDDEGEEEFGAGGGSWGAHVSPAAPAHTHSSSNSSSRANREEATSLTAAPSAAPHYISHHFSTAPHQGGPGSVSSQGDAPQGLRGGQGRGPLPPSQRVARRVGALDAARAALWGNVATLSGLHPSEVAAPSPTMLGFGSPFGGSATTSSHVTPREGEGWGDRGGGGEEREGEGAQEGGWGGQEGGGGVGLGGLAAVPEEEGGQWEGGVGGGGGESAAGSSVGVGREVAPLAHSSQHSREGVTTAAVAAPGHHEPPGAAFVGSQAEEGSEERGEGGEEGDWGPGPDDPELYQLTARIDTVAGSLVGWRFNVYVTDLGPPGSRVGLRARVAHVTTADKQRHLLVPRTRAGTGKRGVGGRGTGAGAGLTPVLSVAELLPWVTAPGQLFGHWVRVEAYSLVPVASKVVDALSFMCGPHDDEPPHPHLPSINIVDYRPPPPTPAAAAGAAAQTGGPPSGSVAGAGRSAAVAASEEAVAVLTGQRREGSGSGVGGEALMVRVPGAQMAAAGAALAVGGRSAMVAVGVGSGARRAALAAGAGAGGLHGRVGGAGVRLATSLRP